MNDERCVCCGVIIPEGRQVCPQCSGEAGEQQNRRDRKMSKYIIKAQVSPTGECNPEFAPEKELADGIQADGFLIMTMVDDLPGVTSVYNLTTMELARVLASERNEAGSVIWEAIAIAEGLIKAKEIHMESRKARMAMKVAEMLRSREGDPECTED